MSKQSPAIPNIFDKNESVKMEHILCRLKISANVFGLGEGGDFHHKC